jgi:magnesium-transporting ATPase (P-type)
MAALNGALYAGVGLLTYLGIFAPIVGVVRFWGIPVVVPAVFAALFGPFVGGVGASIGVFISDMVVHGNALLSLFVGVTSNYVMFHLIGWISAKEVPSKLVNAALGFASVVVVLVFAATWYLGGEIDVITTIIFVIFCALSLLLLLVVNRFWPRWRSYALGSVVGNACGSAIVGIGLWAFSQFFVLPSNMGYQVPLSAAVIWFVWTFSNQMPFLLIFGPPILNACYRAFPSLLRSKSG